MKEFIDKLIERLGNHAFFLNFNFEAEKYLKFDKTISIINELAKEYNGGWIPCSERLPKVNGWYLVTNTLGVVQQQYYGASHWQKLMDEAVIAWCELPAPYTEGE